MLCMLISLLNSIFQILPSTTEQAVSNKEHFLLFFLLGTVEDPRRKTALLPSPGCCGTIDRGALRQLPVLGCSASLLLSQRIRPTACCRHSLWERVFWPNSSHGFCPNSRQIRQPHCACIDYPIVLHSGSQSDASGKH